MLYFQQQVLKIMLYSRATKNILCNLCCIRSLNQFIVHYYLLSVPSTMSLPTLKRSGVCCYRWSFPIARVIIIDFLL